MSHPNETFGIMDEGYFVPRGEILSWINTLLHLNLSKIEQLGSGAVYCQIIDVIHPGKVGLSKVNWKARHDYEFINNLKILQNSFDKIGIKKHVEVEKLAKAKYQDNLEFIQWMKRYFDVNSGQRAASYMPEERRGNVQIDLGFAEKTIIPKAYNASGVIQTPVKNQGQTRRVKSPVSRKLQQKKPTTSTIPSTTKNVDIVKNTGMEMGTNTSTIKEQESQKSSQISEILVKQLEQTKQELKNSKQQTNVYKERSKQGDMKIEMIKQILKSEEQSSMKVTLIEEILKD